MVKKQSIENRNLKTVFLLHMYVNIVLSFLFLVSPTQNNALRWEMGSKTYHTVTVS